MIKKYDGKDLMEKVIFSAIKLLRAVGNDSIADAIENGTSPIRKKSICGAVECNECGTIQTWKSKCDKCDLSFGWGRCGNYREFRARKTWTEHYEIKIVKVKSKPEFERIE